MRTTVTLDDDVAAAVSEFRHQRGVGVSGAINELIRQGLARPAPRERFVQQTSHGGAMIDVADIAEALELLEGPDAR